MKVVACDPGCLGALALLCDGVLTEVVDMPYVSVRRGKSDKKEVEPYALAALLRRWAADVGVVEQVGGMTGQSASAAFNFGRAAGAPEYIMAATGYRVVRVPPQTWKKRLGIKPGKDDSRLQAMRLFPEQAHLFKRVKDDGRAESALIGHWYILGNPTTGASDDVFA